MLRAELAVRELAEASERRRALRIDEPIRQLAAQGAGVGSSNRWMSRLSWRRTLRSEAWFRRCHSAGYVFRCSTRKGIRRRTSSRARGAQPVRCLVALESTVRRRSIIRTIHQRSKGLAPMARPPRSRSTTPARHRGFGTNTGCMRGRSGRCRRLEQLAVGDRPIRARHQNPSIIEAIDVRENQQEEIDGVPNVQVRDGGMPTPSQHAPVGTRASQRSRSGTRARTRTSPSTALRTG